MQTEIFKNKLNKSIIKILLKITKQIIALGIAIVLHPGLYILHAGS